MKSIAITFIASAALLLSACTTTQQGHEEPVYDVEESGSFPNPVLCPVSQLKGHIGLSLTENEREQINCRLFTEKSGDVVHFRDDDRGRYLDFAVLPGDKRPNCRNFRVTQLDPYQKVERTACRKKSTWYVQPKKQKQNKE